MFLWSRFPNSEIFLQKPNRVPTQLWRSKNRCWYRLLHFKEGWPSIPRCGQCRRTP